MPFAQGTSSLTDGANIATILGVVIAFLVAVVPGIVALVRANAAKIAAANAEARAEEAVQAAKDSAAEAKRSADALHEMRGTAGEQLEEARAAAVAPAILRGWIDRAKREGASRGMFSSKSVHQQRTFRFDIEALATLAEVRAAQLAAQHDEIHFVDPGAPELGKRFHFSVYNPSYRDNPNVSRGPENPYRGPGKS